MNQFLLPPQYSIRTASNFFENWRRYLQVKVHHWYQRHWWQKKIPTSIACVVDTGGKFATGVNDIGGKFATSVNGAMPVATCHRYQRHRRRQICHRCKWHWWQTREQLSNCWQLKMNLKKKSYLYAKSTTRMCSKEIIFFHLPPVSTTPAVHLELRISPWIFEKIQNGPNGIIKGLWEIDPCRKPEVKNLVALSL